MLACVRQQLQAYPTTAAEDAAHLQRSAGRRAAAIAYRLEQKLRVGCTAEVLERLAGSGGECVDGSASWHLPVFSVAARLFECARTSAAQERPNKCKISCSVACILLCMWRIERD
jgi:hypothetical protein